MPEQWTILKLLKWTTDFLTEKGINTPRLDSELLLAYALNMDRTHLYMNFDKPLNEDELAAFRALVKKRAAREPVQYIIGHQEFWSMEFKVSPSVLIPRPETELLVEEGAKAIKESFPQCKSPQILDIGSGSGALTAALAKEVGASHVTGVDISPEAVSLARENVEANGLSSSVTILEGDLFGAVEGKLFHLIVSNPPYIAKGDLEALQPEVSRFEPLSALDGGKDGLDYYRLIIPEAPEYLHPGGWLMVEHGEGQSEAIIGMFKQSGQFAEVEAVKDLAGIKRVIKGKRKDSE